MPLYWRVKEWKVQYEATANQLDVGKLVWDNGPFWQDADENGDTGHGQFTESIDAPTSAEIILTRSGTTDQTPKDLVCAHALYFTGRTETPVGGEWDIGMSMTISPTRYVASDDSGVLYSPVSFSVGLSLAWDGNHPAVPPPSPPDYTPFDGEIRWFCTGGYVESTTQNSMAIDVFNANPSNWSQLKFNTAFPAISSLALGSNLYGVLIADTLTLTPHKYHTYGGIYDETTGERV